MVLYLGQAKEKMQNYIGLYSKKNVHWKGADFGDQFYLKDDNGRCKPDTWIKFIPIRKAVRIEGRLEFQDDRLQFLLLKISIQQLAFVD